MSYSDGTDVDPTINYNIAELIGRVTYVKRRKYGPVEFTVHTATMNKSYSCIYDGFCPLHENDTIYALCAIVGADKLQIIKPPFVQIPMDKESMVRCFMRVLRGSGFGNIKANKLYDAIVDNSGSEDKVLTYLSELSNSWLQSRDVDILNLYNEIIRPEQMSKLLKWWHNSRDLRRLYLFGLTNKEINACRLPCQEIYERCIKNPYTLPAISMDKCEDILNRRNLEAAKDDIECGRVVRVIWDNQYKRSWTCTPTYQLCKQFPYIDKILDKLKDEYGVVVEHKTVYLENTAKVERLLAEKIIETVKGDYVVDDAPLDEIQFTEDGHEYLRESANFNNRGLSDDQMVAIQGSLDHKFSIIAGPAGTGKTLCIAEIVRNLELRHKSYVVCSFTGKAVSRIREVSKRRNASTIHRLINMGYKIKKRSAKLEAHDPEGISEDFEYLIMDEASMTSCQLAYDLYKAFNHERAHILVGDPYQLPPIAWGNYFSQLINSRTIPTYMLTNNHRSYVVEGEQDGIILNATAIRNHNPDLPFEFIETDNFFTLEGNIERVYDLIQKFYAQGVQSKQLTILSPFNRELDDLNGTFQQIYDEGQDSVVDSRSKKWMVHDRVIMTKNDYDINVMNGEQGIVREITNKAILVDFGDAGCHEFLLEPTPAEERDKTFFSRRKFATGEVYNDLLDPNETQFDDDERTVKLLQHSYSITIDKSQGSEWDFVILYIASGTNASGSFLHSKRMYTAITRAKRAIFLVGDVEVMSKAAGMPMSRRFENLDTKLIEALPQIVPDPKELRVLEQVAKQDEVRDEIQKMLAEDGMDMDEMMDEMYFD